MLTSGSVTYKSFTLSLAIKALDSNVISKDILLSSNTRAALGSSNKITVKFTANSALSEWQVRITKAENDYGVDNGTKVCYRTNIATGAEIEENIPLTSTYFNEGDGVYRVSLFAQRSFDGLWDVTYIFMTVSDTDSKSHVQFVPSDSTGLEVH